MLIYEQNKRNIVDLKKPKYFKKPHLLYKKKTKLRKYFVSVLLSVHAERFVVSCLRHVFLALALSADSVRESPCPSVCLSVCLHHRKTPSSGGRGDLWWKNMVPNSGL